MSSDTDADEVWTSKDDPYQDRMSADEAKKVAEAKQRQIDEDKRREEAEQRRIRDEMEAKLKVEQVLV
jgi:membrane protein involved in colicin uptake